MPTLVSSTKPVATFALFFQPRTPILRVRVAVRTGKHFVLLDTKTFNGAKGAKGPVFTDCDNLDALLRDSRYSLSQAFVLDAANLPEAGRASLQFRVGNANVGGVNALDSARRFRAAGAEAFKVVRSTTDRTSLSLKPLFVRAKKSLAA